MKDTDALELIRRTGIVAIMRAKRSEPLLEAADAVKDGGVNVIEVTMRPHPVLYG